MFVAAAHGWHTCYVEVKHKVNACPLAISQTVSLSSPQVIRSIGFKCLPVDDGLPFDTTKCVIPNIRGRVTTGETAETVFDYSHLNTAHSP